MKFAAKKIFACIAFAGLFLSSCSRFSIDVTHRKYRPGFHISWSGSGKHYHKQPAKAELKIVPVKMPSTRETNEFIQEKKQVEPKPTGIELSSKGLQKNECRKAAIKIELKPADKAIKNPKDQDVLIHEPQSKDGKIFYWLSGLTALLAAGIAAAQRKRLTKISRWSARNPVLSRCIQVAGHLTLSAAACITGGVLHMQDIIAGEAMIPISTGAFILTTLLSLRGRKKKFITPMYYTKAKMADLTLILGSTMFWASAGNHIVAKVYSSQSHYEISSSALGQSIASLSPVAYQKNESVNYYRQAAKEYTGLRVFGMIMVILGFVLTIMFLAALSCSIYCSGNAPVAFLLFIVGLSLLIYALIKSMIAILAREKIPVK